MSVTYQTKDYHSSLTKTELQVAIFMAECCFLANCAEKCGGVLWYLPVIPENCTRIWFRINNLSKTHPISPFLPACNLFEYSTTLTQALSNFRNQPPYVHLLWCNSITAWNQTESRHGLVIMSRIHSKRLIKKKNNRRKIICFGLNKRWLKITFLSSLLLNSDSAKP